MPYREHSPTPRPSGQPLSRRPRALGATSAALLLLASGLVQADAPPVIDIDDLHPESSVPSPEEALRDPIAMSNLVMELAHQAELSESKNDFARAARYYGALIKAAPDRATPYGRACLAYERAGMPSEALEMCRTAVGRPGATVADVEGFVRLTLASGPLDPSKRADVEAIITHLAEQAGSDPAIKLSVTDLRCQLAAKLEDSALLSTCSRELSALAPDDPRTFLYGAVLALHEEDWDGIEKLAADAEARGLPASAVESLRERARLRRASTSVLPRWARNKWLPASLVLAALAALVAGMSRRRMARSAHS
jgi:hypothetical protein